MCVVLFYGVLCVCVQLVSTQTIHDSITPPYSENKYIETVDMEEIAEYDELAFFPAPFFHSRERVNIVTVCLCRFSYVVLSKIIELML